jgi:hypothetical protein
MCMGYSGGNKISSYSSWTIMDRCLIASFYVLFVCKCVLYYCHRMVTQLQLNISYHICHQTGVSCMQIVNITDPMVGTRKCGCE